MISLRQNSASSGKLPASASSTRASTTRSLVRREVAQGADDEAQLVGGRRVGALQLFGDGRNALADGLARQRLEHRFLAFEVEIDGALGDAGPGGDVVHPRAGKALVGETGQRRLQDFRGALVFAAGPALGLHPPINN